MNKPMLPTLSEDLPEGDEWIYEVKYDGYRAFLKWTEEGIQLVSRNGQDLSSRFPELIEARREATPPDQFPLILDGEIVILNTPYQANFPLLQKRGRMSNNTTIQQRAVQRPATFMAFDLLENGEGLNSSAYTKRKQQLKKIIDTIGSQRVQYVEEFDDASVIRRLLHLHLGEGIVAKQKNSAYENGRTRKWLKYKQWRTVSGFLTSFNPQNEYYKMEIWNKDKRVPLGSFKHGLKSEQAQTLQTFFKEKGTNWRLAPSVCAAIHCLMAEDGEMREPVFDRFRFDLEPGDCTITNRDWDLLLFPNDVEITHPDKTLWPDMQFSKRDYLMYIRAVAPYMIPFIRGKKLTLIRYPHGVGDKSFFQKHRSDHAPNYVESWEEGDETFMISNGLSSLIWLSNQGALEFHIPFQKAGANDPDEIVFDLDPPNREEFYLAVTAAQLLKHLLDKLEVHCFVKTSGNKGMQIHIPIQEGSMTYDETRNFTKSLVDLLIKESPDLFTIERLKKKRGQRLYLDYVQHAEGKTIVSPYSARATSKGTVAAPVFWNEVTTDLNPEVFTIKNVIKRVQDFGCPFDQYDRLRRAQPIDVMKQLGG
ncbi:DNA ligase D [Halobacillus shinanisalinarum]|uniref:DNA ligase (ATP) n=1 Tax=Halobacillus shinanisalinarum TaxID=2932258 RepID=A0ABY4H4H5_9BACI|nr:DNA ligase D [Halobacillus shinanisalinarum]UOQ95368.1 DNA ligase D [Halobacillus shinanisalinarum]